MTQSILLVGSPNSGKSLLFNRLTGLSQKVANFPGITVDVASGKFQGLDNVELIDFPGTYSLNPISAEEEVAVNEFQKSLNDKFLSAVLCVFDVTRMEKSLYFSLQVVRECQKHNKPVFLIANMMDIVENNQLECDLDGLANYLNTPILPLSARSGKGIDQLIQTLKNRDGQNSTANNLAEVDDIILRGEAHTLSHRYGPKGDTLVNTQHKFDNLFLHSGLGGLLFFVVMYLLFQSVFTWSAPFMDFVELSVEQTANWILPFISNNMLKDFTADALFGGIGAFLVFVPQIFILTLIIGFLEDSGYLARAALICHRPLRFFGLTGKSFIPLLSGVACAIPAIYAARSIDSPRKRLFTYMAIPLMPCSARLPVYTLLIAAFIPNNTALWGLVGWQGLAMFTMYFFGIFCALIITGIASRTQTNNQNDLPFVLEMPAYRLPVAIPLIRNAINRSKHFITKAGKIILMVTVAIWILGYFPNQGADLGQSWLGITGQYIEPVFAPLGLDWRYGVAVLTSFLAREVFVGTLGTLFGIEGADEAVLPLVETIQQSGLPIGSGIALLILFALALQCISTLAILSKESQSKWLASKMLVGYGVLSYTLALLAYHIFS